MITAVGTTTPVTALTFRAPTGRWYAGVAAGTTNADLDNAATLDTPIQGAFGKLTLAADGSYSYTRDAGTAGGVSDVFTYTIKDGDGDLSHTTLTISIGNSTPTDTIPGAGRERRRRCSRTAFLRVGEPAGSGEIADGNPTSNSDLSETVSGTIAFTSPDGVSVVSLGGHVSDRRAADVCGWDDRHADGVVQLQCGDRRRGDLLQLHAARQYAG